VKELVSGIHREMEDPNLMQMDEGEAIFVKPATLGIGGLKVKGYAYYNPKREFKEKELFYRKLHEVVEKLKKVRIRRWMNPKDIVAQIAGKLSPYIKWRRVEEQFELEIKKKAVAQRVNRMGRFVLLYQGELDWSECLATYRSKDIVEKGFDMLKNDLKLLPLNAQRDSTLKGLLFGFFLALTLRMRIMKIMQEKELVSKYNLEGMLLELEKIKKIELTDGEVLTSELTRKQREILDKMGLCA
jgi:Transposase